MASRYKVTRTCISYSVTTRRRGATSMSLACRQVATTRSRQLGSGKSVLTKGSINTTCSSTSLYSVCISTISGPLHCQVLRSTMRPPELHVKVLQKDDLTDMSQMAHRTLCFYINICAVLWHRNISFSSFSAIARYLTNHNKNNGQAATAIRC